MRVVWIILSYLFAVFLFLGGVNHVLKPEIYTNLIPPFINAYFANMAAFVAEVTVSILFVIPRLRAWGSLAFTLLMLAFLPLHIWDLFRDTPAVGTFGVAIIRLVMQLVVIGVGWRMYKHFNKYIHE